MSDSGKVGSYSISAPQADGGKDEGGAIAWEIDAVGGKIYSKTTQEEYFTRMLASNRDPDPHIGSASCTHGGSNVPYADQHAPQAGPQTPGPKKGL